MKLTDRKRKEIIEKYVSGGISQRELAKEYQVSRTTISKILDKEDIVQKFTEKATENTLSMLAFMESKNDKAQEIISLIMDELQTKIKTKVEKSSLRDCVASIELLSKTFTFKGDNEKSGKDALDTLVATIQGVSEDE